MKLKSATVAELRKELDRREKGAGKLQAARARLAAQLASMDAELADLGVAVKRGPGRPKGGRPSPAKGRKRAKNKVSLNEALAKVGRAGAIITPADAAEVVRKSGYKTNGARFGVQVATALGKHKGFKRVGRGQYEKLG